MSDFSKLKTRKNGKEYILNVCTQDTEQNIIGTKNFTKLTVNSKNVVTSINGIQPDENGSLTLDVLTTPGNIIKWESDYFDIGPSKTLSFDLTGTVFENEERDNINFQLVAKVKKGNGVLQAGDILFTNYKDYIGSYSATEIGSYSYIRDKKLYIHFGNDDRFVITSCDGTTDTHVSKSDVQCKIILTKIVSGSNGEIDSFSYGIVGYIRYKNGLQLCWGGGNGIETHRTRYTLDTTITFEKPFYDTNYTIIGTGFFVINYAEQCIVDVTTTGFRTRSIANLCATGGYLAIGRWK